MHNELGAKGFEVLGFPCNQFGGQEPGTPAEILAFARDKHSAQFPLFEKVEVNGKNTHPVFRFLRSNSSLFDKNERVAAEIPWNFAKFLVNSQGKVVDYYGPQTAPEDIRPDIEKLLKE